MKKPGQRWGSVLAVFLLGACARPGPPPGGPVDTTAPTVMTVSPADQSTGVPTDTTITILFSEKIDRSTLEKALWITPAETGKPRLSYSGTEVTIQTGNGFPEATTVAVLLTSVIKDRKREGGQQNILTRPHRWIFSTADSVWPGVVSGKVERVGGAETTRHGQLLVAVYPVRADSFDAPGEPLAITEADSAGAYRLDGLPVGPDTLWVFSMMDLDGNREVRGRGEFVTADPRGVVVSENSPEQVVSMRHVSPDEPGSFQGTLAGEPGDTAAVWIEAHTADADTATAPAKRVLLAGDRTFLITGLKPGRYRVITFCDSDADGSRDPGEPFVEQGWVEIQPGRKLEIGVWTGPVCVP